MRSKITKYENARRATAETAAKKATQTRDGEAAFSFRYRNQQVWVTAKESGGKVRIHTDSVKNK